MSVLTPYDVDNDRDYREGARWPLILLGVLVAGLLVAGAGLLYVQHKINPPGAPGAFVAVRVEKGMSVSDVANLLEKKGVISSASVFKYYVRLNGLDPVQAGDYAFHKKESMGTVVKILNGGAKSADQPVVLTVPEGLTLKEVAEKIGELPGRSADKFLAAAASGEVRSQYEPPGVNNLEGLTFPDTYFIGKNEDETAILRRMVDQFDKTATSLGLSDAAAKLKVTPYQAVVAASIVEREALLPEDQAPIARVIFNRLAAGMRLQMDSTVLYALGQHKALVTYADLEVNSPYNTYKVDGLPVGPIATPGKGALSATLNPAPGPWLYFVLADASGKQAFATTIDEFNRLSDEGHRKGLF